MARRSKKGGVAEDLLAIASKLPWWVSLILAVVSFVVLHAVAGQELGSATSTADVGRIAARGLFRALAGFGQYVLPLLFVIGAAASVLGQKKRERLVTQVAEGATPASLNEMTWREFEGLVQEAFRLRGYAVRRRGGEGADGGVDLVLERGAEKVLVQCKQWRALRVGVSVVRELYGVMAAEGAAAGIVVTSGSFTPDAVEFASGRNVRLIEGHELFEMIREARAAQPRTAGVSAAPLATASTGARGCPVCGSPMVRREAKRGANAGKAFYGCSRFPMCRGVREAL